MYVAYATYIFLVLCFEEEAAVKLLSLIVTSAMLLLQNIGLPSALYQFVSYYARHLTNVSFALRSNAKRDYDPL